MRGKGLPLFLAAVLSGAPEATWGQGASDPEVAKGVRQVEEGDYETAIFTLDTATRRLAGQRAHSTPGNYRVGVFHRVTRIGAVPPHSTSGATDTLRDTHP